MSTPARRPVVSLEYLRVKLVETQGLTIAAAGVQFAFKDGATQPSGGDWVNGEWQDAGAQVPSGAGFKYVRTARILVGPGGTYVPIAGTKTVWYKFADTPEIPARSAGTMTWY
jgi:hypothetical protein